MGRPKFGDVGDEREILSVIRRMNDAGDKQATILRALASAGYTTRGGKPFSRQAVQKIVVDLDRGRRVRLDLRQRSSRLSESLAEARTLSATDASCALILAQVQTLLEGGLPQVDAIAEAVAV